ncbi:hypothetical protein GCM10023331_13980 [Algivirga pacifica]|uniref:Tetratricopeptide repeat-containing protein n=2 Tax=Algivirga pacifica TaxID=1162670 RepID=A0ABP9D677_9BACT
MAFAQNALAYYVIGEKFREHNEPLKAIDQYNKAIKIDPANPQFHYQKGMCYLSLRQFENALNAFKVAEEYNPNSLETHKRLYNIYMQKDYFDDAIYHLDRIFELSPHEKIKIQAKYSIVSILFKLERLLDTEKHLLDLLKLNPIDTRALFFCAKLYNEQGNYTKAKEAALSALQHLQGQNYKVTVPYYFELCKSYYYLKEYNALNEAIQRASYGRYRELVFPYTSMFKLQVANCYYNTFDFKTAAIILQEALQQGGNEEAIYQLQLKISGKKADKSKLIEHCLIRIQEQPDTLRVAQYLAELSNLYMDQGNYAKVIQTTEQCLKITPDNYKLEYLKAIAFIQSNQRKQGIEILERITTYRGLNVRTKAAFNFTLAQAYLLEKRKREADLRLLKAKIDTQFKYAVMYLQEQITQQEL